MFAPIDTDGGTDENKKIDTSKVYKIRYSINILTSVGSYIKDVNGKKEYINDDVNLMGLCAESEELEIFDSESIMQMI